MLNRLKSFFADNSTDTRTAPDSLNLACAALLVHAAALDGDIADSEQVVLTHILQTAFAQTAEDSAELLALAHKANETASDLYRWTHIINKNYEEAQKIAIIEHLWMVVLADGRLDDYEANLLRRIAGLIHVSDRASGAARKRIEKRLGEQAGG